MADYAPLPPVPPSEQLRREVLAVDATASVEIVFGKITRISAPKIDVATLTGILAKYPSLVAIDTLTATVVDTPIVLPTVVVDPPLTG